MPTLAEEITAIMQEHVQNTTLGMAGWVRGPEGVRAEVPEMPDDPVVELTFAMFSAHGAAILRLANEVEALKNAST